MNDEGKDERSLENDEVLNKKDEMRRMRGRGE